MDKRKILLQLDTDQHPSVFDRVVAVDAGADEVFSYGGVKPEHVQALVHGAIFTRDVKELKYTALFIGGSDVAAAEKLMREAIRHMIPQFGLRVSVLLDANGANTTAAAAVRAAARHLELQGLPALVLGGTGPVGQRVARLLALRRGGGPSGFTPGSTRGGGLSRNRQQCAWFESYAGGNWNAGRIEDRPRRGALIIAAGAAGAVLVPRSARIGCPTLKVVIDLNAVPPLGIEGVEVTDKAAQRDGVMGYGAIGIGGTKMKVHKAALTKLFESNDQVMDAEEVFQIAQALG